MLKYFITSKTKRKLLKLFLTNPDKSFYIRQMGKITNEPINAIRRELGYLEAAGFLDAHREGNLKYYKINKNFPFYEELKRMIYATIGLGDYLRERILKQESIDLAFIYGSVARNEEGSRSDIDLFVVGDIMESELHKITSDIEASIRREINYVLMTKQEFQQRLLNNDSFLKRVLKEDKIVIKEGLGVSR